MTVEYPHVDAAFYTAALSVTVRDYNGQVLTKAMGELGGNYDDTTLSDDFDATDSTLAAAFNGTIVRRTDFTVDGGHVTLEEVWSDADNAMGDKYTTTHAYDDAGRKETTENPAGTITRWTYDVLDRKKTRSVGTIDGGMSDNMSLVEESFYDDEEDTATNVGDGTLTRRTVYTVDGGSAITTDHAYDYRSREIQRDEPLDVQVTQEYTNLNQVAVTERNDTSSGTVLMASTENLYDSWGRVYEVRVSGVSGGSASGYASVRTWLNARGLPIKTLEQGKVIHKTQYDAAGRVTNKATTYDTSETAYGDADDLTGDTVVEETRYVLDGSGQAELVGYLQRNHDGAGTGALDGSSGNARAQYTCTWFDPMHRTSKVALYGTNDGADLSARPGGTPPSTGASEADQEKLVTTYAYTVKSEVLSTTDHMGRVLRTEYDDPGHLVSRIEDYAGTARAMDYTYDSAGRLWKTTANASGADQITENVYGVLAGSDNSTVSSNDYVYQVKWPDSTVQDTFAYNAQGALIWKENAHGTEHFLDHDDRGRLIHDRATATGSGIDTAALRISRTYDALDRPIKVTSYSSATVGAGSVLNEVQYEYTRFDRISKLYQQWDAAVNTSTSPRIEYAYSFPSTGDVGIRRTSSTLTGGQVVTDEYDTGIDDNLSRLSGRKASSAWLFQDSYLGMNRLIEREFATGGRVWTLVGSSLDAVNNDYYVGLDRMGRIDDLIVKNGGTNLNRYVYTYNYNSQITLREDKVGTVSGQYEFDEKLTYDTLGRLTEHKRGKDLNGSPTVRACRGWSLNLSGGTTTLTSGTSSCSASTTFTFDTKNRITYQDSIPYTYNGSGGLTTGANYHQIYDAWGRLVEVNTGSSYLARYKYNGLNWKIKRTDSPSFLDTYYYYNEDWQLLEERKVSNGDVLYWYVWGTQYIDDLVLRSVNGGSSTKYFVQDARFNTVTVLNYDYSVSCRYCYGAYGTPLQLSADWTTWQSLAEDRFLFTGRFYTKDVAQGDLRSRAFDGEVNYFIQEDLAGRLYDQRNFGERVRVLRERPGELRGPVWERELRVRE